MLGLPEGDTDPFFDTLGGGSADVEVDSSDEERDTVRDQEADGLEEPPELRAARAALAAYTARPGEEEPPGERVVGWGRVACSMVGLPAAEEPCTPCEAAQERCKRLPMSGSSAQTAPAHYTFPLVCAPKPPRATPHTPLLHQCPTLPQPPPHTHTPFKLRTTSN
jgi:hypothetical protein